jgi:hypothetical protein
MATELTTNRLSIRSQQPQKNVASHHEHAGRAKAALQGMTLMKMSAQYLHNAIGCQPF